MLTRPLRGRAATFGVVLVPNGEAAPGGRRAAGALPLCDRCRLADTPQARLRGLVGVSSLAPDEGLLLRPARSVHSCFMRFAIDVVFLDGAKRVVAVAERLRPWRFASCRGARSAFELPAGTWARSDGRVGDRVRYSPRFD